MNKSIFLDASFWVALRNRRDVNFAPARDISKEIARRGFALITTTLVAAETHAFFSRSSVRFKILEDIENIGVMKTESLSPNDQHTAIRLLRRFADKEFSLCDGVSFAVMERLGINRALSFDGHFRQYAKVQIISRPEDV
jgi:predicted nucleic acid-binding protein